MINSDAPFATVGHSNRSSAEFTDLLLESEVELVVDVRRLPGSTRYPHFDREALRTTLGAEGLGYRQASGLTGRRPVSVDVPFEVNAWWQNRSFHNYADHALTTEFSEALADLLEWGGQRRTAVMCSEAVWWRCHRRIIADHLLAHGAEVINIIGPDNSDVAQLSPGGVIGDDHRVRYPAGDP